MTDIEYIHSKIQVAEILAQVAEECNELAHAALKLRRALDGTNPTPVSVKVASDRVREEYSDLLLCLCVLSKLDVPTSCREKLQRWVERLREADND